MIAGGAWWFIHANRPASVATKAPAEGARLSIVVTPFANLSGDPGQDYIVDALTDELTTGSRAHPRHLRHRAQHRHDLQGQADRRQGDRQGFGRALCSRRLGAAERRSDQGQRPAHRRRQRRSPLGRAIRYAPRRSVADAGRDRRASGERARLSTHPSRGRAPQTNARRQSRRRRPSSPMQRGYVRRPDGSARRRMRHSRSANRRSPSTPTMSAPCRCWGSSSRCQWRLAFPPTPKATSSGPMN